MIHCAVLVDFDNMDYPSRPMKEKCSYNRERHFCMATRLTIQAFSWQECVMLTREVQDFIHGLNHLFFNGFAAGEWVERKNHEG